MEQLLRILHLEDAPADTEMVRQLLHRDGLNVQIDRVDTLPGLQAALASQSHALILSDFAMPGLDPIEALKLSRELRPDVPFIFLSGTLGEDLAIETLKMGANDYVLKQRIQRLATAVRRALQEVEEQARRKQAEDALRESEERYRALINASSPVIYRMSPDWSEMIQLRGENFITDTEEPRRDWLQEYIHPDDQAFVREAIGKAVSSGSVFELEHRVRRKDGTYGWTLSRAVPLRNPTGEIAEWFGAANDITERKRAEETLREADRRKDEFLAMLSHELRNPLAPVRNAIQVLRLVGSKEPPAVRQHDIIERQVTHMARLLDDLLDVSRITRGKIELKKQPFDLAAVLEQAVEMATPLMEAKRLSLSAAPSQAIRVEADPDRLAQVFGNLLTNAAKYTPEGGQIWLEVGLEDGQAVVRVRDTGVGIAPEILPRIFELFAQADQGLARSQGGLGIGLTMVQRLVQMHGGAVEARSEGAGRGSEFIVRLPLLPERAPAPSPPPLSEATGAAASTQPACRVLIIEDNQDAADSLRDLLELLGHPVQSAYDGPTGLERAAEFRPEVILLDLGLPGMNGYEVARRIKGDGNLQTVFLVALTGYGQDEDRVRTSEAGFDRHLTKPVDLTELQVLLHRVCLGPSQ